jgi:endoglucanase
MVPGSRPEVEPAGAAAFVILDGHTMLLARLATLLGAAAVAGCIPIPEVAKVGPPAVAKLRRGINAGNALDAPSEGAWGPALDEAYFDYVAAAGFDHVRIPIRFSAYAATAAPYTVDPTFFARVDWAVDQAQQRGLTAIVDFHYFEELLANPEAQAPRFVGIWRQIAARYRGRPASVLFELLNEPTKNMTADKWNTILAQALAAVRAVDPTRKVIVDSVFWAAAKELPNLQLPAGDPNLIGNFHTYQPILFTRAPRHRLVRVGRQREHEGLRSQDQALGDGDQGCAAEVTAARAAPAGARPPEPASSRGARRGFVLVLPHMCA